MQKCSYIVTQKWFRFEIHPVRMLKNGKWNLQRACTRLRNEQKYHYGILTYI